MPDSSQTLGGGAAWGVPGPQPLLLGPMVNGDAMVPIAVVFAARGRVRELVKSEASAR